MPPYPNLFPSLSEAEITLAKSRRLISPLTGVIRSVEELPLDLEDAADLSIFGRMHDYVAQSSLDAEGHIG